VDPKNRVQGQVQMALPILLVETRCVQAVYHCVCPKRCRQTSGNPAYRRIKRPTFQLNIPRLSALPTFANPGDLWRHVDMLVVSALLLMVRPVRGYVNSARVPHKPSPFSKRVGRLCACFGSCRGRKVADSRAAPFNDQARACP
jgi:hypothetical protein